MIDLILQVIAFFTGIVGMPVINWVKKIFNLSGRGALLVATLVSLLLGVFAAYAGGALSASEVTLETVINAAGIVFSTATIFYKAIGVNSS